MIFDRPDPLAARFQQGFSDARPTWQENYEAALQDFTRVDSVMSRRFGLEGIWGDLTDRLNTDLGDRYMRLGTDTAGAFPDPSIYFGTSDSYGNGDARYQYEAQRVIDQVRRIEAAEPGTVSPEIMQLMDLAAIEERVREEAVQARDTFNEMRSDPRGGGGFARFLGGLTGGMQEFVQDPSQTVTIVAGMSRNLLRFAFQEAALNAGIEVMRQPQVARWYDELGLEYTREQFIANVAIAGVAGGTFAVGVRGLQVGAGATAGAASRVLTPAIDRALGRRDAGIFARALDAEQPDMTVALTMQQLRTGVEAMQSAGVRLSSEATAAYRMSLRFEEDTALNPGLPPAEHSRLLDSATLAVASGRLPSDLIDRPPEALPAEALAAAQPEVDNLGGVLYAFDPRDIQVDARTFQFKEGGDEFGVTDRLQFITEWDPALAGVVTVYEFADGRLFIADGHQRVGLARRLLAENPNADIQLFGYRLREVDGITPQEAMVSAAITNIAQGTGSAIDAAKIARMDPDRFNDLVGRTLPPTSQLVRQARDMMALSQDAFGAVINDVVPSNYGAVVGRILADRPDLQMAAIGVLAKAEPPNVFQAEAIVRQVREADADVATQSSLFGDELVVESLYAERAKVLDRAVKQLRQDRAAFASLTRNAETIEAAGNVLDAAVNQRRADLDAQAISLVQTLANRKGALSDALSEAARVARDGNIAGATRQFVESIRGAIRDGDFERLANSEPGRLVDDTPPIRRSEVGEEPSLAGFDEPTGHGPAVEQQADDLTREMFPEDVPGQAPPARAGEPEPAAAVTEATEAGEQMVIPGAERISDRQLAERRGAEAMRGGQEAPPEGGLFDETARAQEDLFAGADLDEEIPIGALVDDEGNVVAQTTTLRDMKAMLDEEDAFIDRLGFCTR